MERVLVTGGAGFIGSHLCAACVEAGDAVAAVDDLSTGARENLPAGAEFVEADLGEPGLAERLIREVRPDVVYHLAAQSSVIRSVAQPLRDFAANASATLALLEACREADAPPRFVYASTGGAAYGTPEAIPVSEDHPTEAHSPYALSKRTGEEYVALYARLFGLPAVSLRLANVFGPRQRGDLEAGVVSIFAKRLAEGEPVILYGEGRAARDYVYVADVAEAFRLAGQRMRDGSCCNVGTGVATEVEEVLRRVSAALGREPVRVDRVPLRKGEVFRVSLDASRFRRATGWRPAHTFAEGIEAFAEWFKAHAPRD